MKPYILFDTNVMVEIKDSSNDFQHQTIDFYRWLLVNRPKHSLVVEFNGEAGAIDINTLKMIVPDHQEQQIINKPKRTRKPKKVS